MPLLNALMVAVVAASAVWVYLDATKHKIGKIPGGKGLFNMSAGAWGIVTLMLWIIGFSSYLLKRKSLAEQAKIHPIEVGGRGIKTAILAVAGGFWFLAAVANTLTSQADGSRNSGAGSIRSWFDTAASTISTSEWELSETTSGIDGKTLAATRVYPFDSRNTQFHVEITCNPQSRKTGMTIQSIVGSMESPTEQSAFSALHLENGSMPVARVKFKDGNVFSTPLYTYFALGEYANKAVFIASSMLGEALPMLLEIGNGTGTYELAIDRSGEVEKVLAACGQDEASLARAEMDQKTARQVEQIAAQQEQLAELKDMAITAIKQSCRQFGSPSEFGLTNPGYFESLAKFEEDIARLPEGIRAEISLDCARIAPDELSSFQTEFDAEYSYYERTGGSCTRDQFLSYARSLNSGISSMQARQCGEYSRSANDQALHDAVSAADSAAENPEQ
ncbi:hypothetical protein [Thermomonas mangrovi]|uniref:hypothetical protein n=1 Tax=Thermomonas mangrovi TaxID=2993316 RepID=UPI0023079FE5|nr:hypothetical protein [Thermomonas mangrovi]